METIIHIITSVIETGAITFLIYMIIKGLRKEIKSLHNQIQIQNETIKTMDKRIEETEKIGDLYKRLVSDFPQALEDYQAVVIKTKDKTIYELKSKIEEHESTINKLNKIKNSTNINYPDRAKFIGNLFLNPKNMNLLEFLQNLEIDELIVFISIQQNNKFDDLIKDLHKEIVLVSEDQTKELFLPESFEKYKARVMSKSNFGSYMVTFDDKVYLTDATLNNLRSLYNSFE